MAIKLEVSYHSRISRSSLRLPDYDYSLPGAYFVTLVTSLREHLFGEIKDGEVRLNDMGKIVWEVWRSLPIRYPNISLDEAVVMPNHFHGIVIIEEKPVAAIQSEPVAAIHELPLRRELPSPQQTDETLRLARRKMLLPKIIGYLKMNSAKRVNILFHCPGTHIWQRNYYEHIVRNDRAFNAIRYYIQSNPARWETDEENRSKTPLTA
jgi:putative transposase